MRTGLFLSAAGWNRRDRSFLPAKHAMIVAVHDVQDAGRRMNEHAVRLVERHAQGFVAVALAGLAFLARAGQADDLAVLGRVFADDVIGGVGDDYVVIAIDAQMFRPVEGSLPGVAAVAAVALGAGPRHGADLPLGIDDAQRMSAAFENVDVSLAIGASGARIDERGRLGVGAVLRDPLRAAAGDVMDLAGLDVDKVDLAVIEIGKVEPGEVGIEGDAVDAAEPGRQRRFAVRGRLVAAPREGGDLAGLRINLGTRLFQVSAA